MIRKSIYIPILLLLFTILQINNNYYYINLPYNDSNSEYKDYIKEKTLSENFHNQLIKSEFQENISNIKQNNLSDDSLCLISLFNFINIYPNKQIQVQVSTKTNHLNLNVNSRAPPIFTLYS